MLRRLSASARDGGAHDRPRRRPPARVRLRRRHDPPVRRGQRPGPTARRARPRGCRGGAGRRVPHRPSARPRCAGPQPPTPPGRGPPARHPRPPAAPRHRLAPRGRCRRLVPPGGRGDPRAGGRRCRHHDGRGRHAPRPGRPAGLVRASGSRRSRRRARRDAGLARGAWRGGRPPGRGPGRQRAGGPRRHRRRRGLPRRRRGDQRLRLGRAGGRARPGRCGGPRRPAPGPPVEQRAARRAADRGRGRPGTGGRGGWRLGGLGLPRGALPGRLVGRRGADPTGAHRGARAPGDPLPARRRGRTPLVAARPRGTSRSPSWCSRRPSSPRRSRCDATPTTCPRRSPSPCSPPACSRRPCRSTSRCAPWSSAPPQPRSSSPRPAWPGAPLGPARRATSWPRWAPRGTVLAVLAVVSGAPDGSSPPACCSSRWAVSPRPASPARAPPWRWPPGWPSWPCSGWAQHPLAAAHGLQRRRPRHGRWPCSTASSSARSWPPGCGPSATSAGSHRDVRLAATVVAWVLGLGASTTVLVAFGTLVGARLGEAALGFTIGHAVATVTWMLAAAWLLLRGLERSRDADLTLRTGLLLAGISVAKLLPLRPRGAERPGALGGVHRHGPAPARHRQPLRQGLRAQPADRVTRAPAGWHSGPMDALRGRWRADCAAVTPDGRGRRRRRRRQRPAAALARAAPPLPRRHPPRRGAGGGRHPVRGRRGERVDTASVAALAAWFHDAVYAVDPAAANEAESASLAARQLGAARGRPRADRPGGRAWCSTRHPTT